MGETRLRPRLGRLLNRWRTRWRLWRHRARLEGRVKAPTAAYRRYLEQQLQRTLRKDSGRLLPRTVALVDRIAEMVDLRQASVLCVGCRNRAELAYFRRRGAAQVTGIDLLSSDPDILIMDMHRLEFAPHAFDVVYSSHSLEHAYDPHQVIGELVRVCRPGGIIGVEVPVRYKTNETDRVDFGGIEGLRRAFATCDTVVLWYEDVAEAGRDTPVVRATLRRNANSGAAVARGEARKGDKV